MTCAALISQSNYIPWRGYFDLIASADIFIILDDVQYTRRDWRNRNRIKTPTGSQWISIPIISKGKYLQRINETMVAGPGWSMEHWKTLEHNYRKAPFFDEISAWLMPLYRQAAELTLLSEINRNFLEAVCRYLDISTRFHWSTDFFSIETLDGFDKNQRILELCNKVGANRYISGPLALEYMDKKAFEAAGIDVDFADYGHYPPYPQMHGAFDPYISIIDTLFNTGKKTRDYTVGYAIR